MTDSTSVVLEVFPKGTTLGPNRTPTSIAEGANNYGHFIEALKPLEDAGMNIGYNIHALGKMDIPSALFAANAESIEKLSPYIRANFSVRTNRVLKAH